MLGDMSVMPDLRDMKYLNIETFLFRTFNFLKDASVYAVGRQNSRATDEPLSFLYCSQASDAPT